MRSWEGRAGPAAIHKGRYLGLVCRTKAIDKLRQRFPVIAHLEDAMRERFLAPPAAVSLHRDVERFLIEVAYMNLARFAEDNAFHAVAGNVIARHLYLRDKLAL